MAITDITISQDNIEDDSNLLPIHSILTFIADITYTSTAPDVIHVEIRDPSDTILETYKAIPYNDLSSTVRQFVFIANGPIKSLMNSFDDTFQTDETIEYVDDITELLKIRFVDPDTSSTYDEVEINFVHGASQFGQLPNLVDQFNNESDIFYAAKDGIIYIYFYNYDDTNIIGFEDNDLSESNALDYDDAIFTDYDDTVFTILT